MIYANKIMDESKGKIGKLLQRLEAALTAKRFYEAHQIFKTIHFRCCLRRNYSEAVIQLMRGAKYLLRNQQWESGIDLACLVVDVHAKSKLEMTSQHLEELIYLLRLMSSSCDERDKFISKVIHLISGNQKLLEQFNDFLGRLFWHENSFMQARTRMMLSGNGFAVGCFLIELHLRYGFHSEIDMFITQAVLQFLSMKKETLAALTFYTYIRRHPKLEPGPPYESFPLLNFIWFLMLAIEHKYSLAVFSLLCTKYDQHLDRDPSFATYIEKISQLYFGVQPQKSEFNGLLSTIVRLIEGNEDNEICDPSSNSPSTSCTMHFDEID